MSVLHITEQQVHTTILKRLMASRHVSNLQQEQEQETMKYTFTIKFRNLLRYSNLLYCFRESGIKTMRIVNGTATITVKL